MTAEDSVTGAVARPVRAKTTAISLTILLLAGLLACSPLLVHGLPDWSNDGIEHVVWAKAFYNQLWNGDWYPRWLTNVNAGYGSPVFFVYSPLPVYASGLFWPLLESHDAQSWYTLGLSAILSLIFTAFAVYFWCRDLAGERAALFAGLISIVVPYHLAVNIYTRGGMAELWAVVWLPLIMLAVQRLAKNSRLAFHGLALSYAGLILSHLPTTLCFSLVPPAGALFFSERGQRVRVFLKTCAGMAAGILVASIYLVPALAQRHDIQENLLMSGWFDYHRWWLIQIHEWRDARMRLLLLTISTAVFLIAAFAIAVRRGNPEQRRRAQFYFGVSVAALFMSTQLSAPVWSLIPILHSLSFPTRFLQILVLTTPGLAALAFPYVRKQAAWPSKAILSAMTAAWLVASVWGASKAFSVWRPFPADNAAIYGKVLKFQRSILDYWPRWAPAAQVGNFPEFETFVNQHPPKAAELAAPDGHELSAPVVEVSQPREMTLWVDAPEPATLTVNHFYYTGWEGHIAGSGAKVNVVPSKPEGFLLMKVPKGQYRLNLELIRTAPERWGGWISLIAAAGILLSAAFELFRSRARREAA